MTLETQVKETQLEFPFLPQMRMLLYVDKQRAEMKALYELSYRYDGDHGPVMRFGDFFADVWVKQGLAEKFREKYHKQYFYDDPDQ